MTAPLLYRPARLGVALLALLAPCSAQVRAETLAAARYEMPVTRYGHFALGPPHEYARLAATTDAGRGLHFDLGPDEVFEDLAPRRVRLASGAAEHLLAIVSHRDSGARLALFGLLAGRLSIIAESPPIGVPRRWMNPVGVADLDGDGVAEFAAVTTPHIGGRLRVYRREGGRLVEFAALDGFSNHIYGSSALGLSTILRHDGKMLLAVPSDTRRRLRILALAQGRLVERATCTLESPVVGTVQEEAPGMVSLELDTGRRSLRLADCPAP